MYSRELTFTDLVTGEERTQTFYFNLTEFETTEWALMDDLEELVATRDRTRILRALRRLVRHSVCQRFGDEIGKPEYYGDIFIASNAHSVLMMDLLGASNEKEQAAKIDEFLNGIVPWLKAKRAAEAIKPQDHLAKKETTK